MRSDLEVGEAGTERVYKNQGNEPLLDLLDPGRHFANVLDVGCGAGDNAWLLKRRDMADAVYGLTMSDNEKDAASDVLDGCVVCDVGQGIPEEIETMTFDLLLFSHVLEHLRAPNEVLASFLRLLSPGGVVLMAVPNVLTWKQRMQFLAGRFEYQPSGVLDSTHLRFFTYETADAYIFSGIDDLRLVDKQATGWMPLGGVRRVLSESQAQALDQWACRVLPNFFGYQIMMKGVKE